ncbi:hypothetical protein [Lacisediminihabitans sp.]|uniref:hypothetical protein n=1 Tax=Lacisediminihabitans sp. TaxID=2787631 RepID=UPI00374D8672
MQSALRDDALTTTATGVAVRIGLPWIRSLPLACVQDLVLTLDGEPVSEPQLVLGDRVIPADRAGAEQTWWFAQDRLVVATDRVLRPGIHDVEVTFRLLIPYLLAGPGGGPLVLPVRLSGHLDLDGPTVPSVSLDVA